MAGKVRIAQIIDGVEHYECRTGCRQWLPRAAFFVHRSPDTKCGLQSRCKMCVSKQRAARARNRDKAREAAAAEARRVEQDARDARWAIRLKRLGVEQLRSPAGSPIPILVETDINRRPYSYGQLPAYLARGSA